MTWEVQVLERGQVCRSICMDGQGDRNRFECKKEEVINREKVL